VLVLDPMTLEFPVSDCFPVTSPRVIAYGPYCDAAGCPPGTPVDVVGCSSTFQDGFTTELTPLVLGRFGAVSAFGGTSVHARVVPGESRIEIVTGGGGSSNFDIDYDPNGATMDLQALAPDAFVFEITGDVTPQQPLFLTMWIESDLTTSPVHQEVGAATVTRPGTVEIPWTSFTIPPGGPGPVDRHHVGYMYLSIYDCEFPACETGTDFPARAYGLGPIHLRTLGPTPTARRTWGEVKRIYR
jgi:hypothetical protein